MINLNIFNSVVLIVLLTLPLMVAIYPSVIEILKDQLPDQVERSNPLFILFSPYLDRNRLARKETPRKILEANIKTGTYGIVDTTVKPIIGGLEVIQATIARALNGIREGIQRALSIPMRQLFNMATTLSKSLNSVLDSIVGIVTGVFRTIRDFMMNMLGLSVVALYTQITTVNTLYASIGFFMYLLKILGGIIIALGTIMMFFFWLIPFAASLITIGSIMVNISIRSEAIIPKK
jgi:hypothetical protein